jgi:hypothetical protein
LKSCIVLYSDVDSRLVDYRKESLSDLTLAARSSPDFDIFIFPVGYYFDFVLHIICVLNYSGRLESSETDITYLTYF